MSRTDAWLKRIQRRQPVAYPPQNLSSINIAEGRTLIIYLHDFDATSPGNHEKVLQLQLIDPDVRLISYSTCHPCHDMQHLLKEVDKMQQLTDEDRPLICGVGLGGFWDERIGFLCDMRQVILNPNLFPEENMQAKLIGQRNIYGYRHQIRGELPQKKPRPLSDAIVTVG